MVIIIYCKIFRIVIETLEDVSPDRKCARMIGGVLVDRTVKEILPALTTNRDQVCKTCFNVFFNINNRCIFVQ